MLCGKTSLKSIARFAKAHRAEFAEYMPLPRGKIPSYSTFQRASLRIKIDDTCAAFASTGSAQAINGCHNI